MGMTEFELGDQAKALKRIFKEGLKIHKVSVQFIEVEKDVDIFLLAGKNFPSSCYQYFVKLLANNEYRTSEPTYMHGNIMRMLNLLKDESYFEQVDAWFDFENDVLMVLSEEQACVLFDVLVNIKVLWETPDSPELHRFKQDLAEVKDELRQANKGWLSLDFIREVDGGYHVWLNPLEQKDYHYGWFELDDLKLWAKDKGPIMMNMS